MKNKIIRTFTVTLAAVLCLTAFSTTAFAGGTDPNPEPLPETTEAPQEEEPTTGGMEPEGISMTSWWPLPLPVCRNRSKAF